LDLVCHLPAFVSTADLTPRIREASVAESLEALEVASALGADRVVAHPGFFAGLGRYTLELSRKYAMESLREILRRAADLELKVCMENMFPQAGWMVTAEDFAPLMEAFPDLAITLDVGHANIEGGTQRALDFIDRYPHRIGHLHVSDNWGRRDDHLPLGAGNVDLRSILSALKGIPYDGWITFEVFSPDRDYLRISREKLIRIWESIS
jgi:sugar phosphate isomerase/epimerase